MSQPNPHYVPPLNPVFKPTDNTELRTAIDEILDKLVKDIKFHKKGITEAKSAISEMHYNDILKVNVNEAKVALDALFSKTIATKTREAAANEVYKAINMMDTNKTDYAATYHYLIERLAQLKPPTGEK